MVFVGGLLPALPRVAPVWAPDPAAEEAGRTRGWQEERLLRAAVTGVTGLATLGFLAGAAFTTPGFGSWQTAVAAAGGSAVTWGVSWLANYGIREWAYRVDPRRERAPPYECFIGACLVIGGTLFVLLPEGPRPSLAGSGR